MEKIKYEQINNPAESTQWDCFSIILKFEIYALIASRKKNSVLPFLLYQKVAVRFWIKKETRFLAFPLLKIEKVTAGGGTWTHTWLPTTDFESASSAIPTHRHKLSTVVYTIINLWFLQEKFVIFIKYILLKYFYKNRKIISVKDYGYKSESFKLICGFTLKIVQFGVL